MIKEPKIKYNKYVIRGNEKLVIPVGEPPEGKETKPDMSNLKKLRELKEEIPIKSLETQPKP